MKTPPVKGITSRSSSSTAARHSSDVGQVLREHLDPEPDVALLVAGDVLHPREKPGIVPSLVKKSSMKCCPGCASVASTTMW